MKKLLFFFFLVILFSLSSLDVSADYKLYPKDNVLGSKSVSEAAMPPTIEGPGFLLPDNPLYFLDTLKQKVRLTLAFSPERKAKLHSDIAGERFAELRFMLSKQNQNGIEKTLLDMKDHTQAAAAELKKAQLHGTKVIELARTLNEQIKRRDASLEELEENSSGDVQADIKRARVGIDEAKLTVEENLPEDELAQELKWRLEDRLEEAIAKTTEASEMIKHDISELQKQASAAAESYLTRRQEVLIKSIDLKKSELQKLSQQSLEDKEKAQKVIDNLGEDEKEIAEKMMEMAKEAEVKYLEMKKVQESLQSFVSSFAKE